MRQREKDLKWREQQLALREQSVKEAEVSLSAETEQVCLVLSLAKIVHSSVFHTEFYILHFQRIIKMQFRIKPYNYCNSGNFCSY